MVPVKSSILTRRTSPVWASRRSTRLPRGIADQRANATSPKASLWHFSSAVCHAGLAAVRRCPCVHRASRFTSAAWQARRRPCSSLTSRLAWLYVMAGMWHRSFISSATFVPQDEALVTGIGSMTLATARTWRPQAGRFGQLWSLHPACDRFQRLGAQGRTPHVPNTHEAHSDRKPQSWLSASCWACQYL